MQVIDSLERVLAFSAAPNHVFLGSPGLQINIRFVVGSSWRSVLDPFTDSATWADATANRSNPFRSFKGRTDPARGIVDRPEGEARHPVDMGGDITVGSDRPPGIPACDGRVH
jgi:hypothetical protein